MNLYDDLNSVRFLNGLNHGRIALKRTGIRLALLFPILLVTACGAKTGLLIPEEDVGVVVDADEEDADVGDADVEDAESDSCIPEPVNLDRQRAQVMFIIDRSSSMSWTLEGNLASPWEDRRWNIRNCPRPSPHRD